MLTLTEEGGIIVKNNSSRFVKTTAKILVALLAVCLVFTALPLLSPAALPVAEADAVTYQVPSGATVDQITAQLATYAAGTEVNVLLQSDIDFTSKNKDTNGETIGIVIPSGITVNLYMNGKTIKYVRNSRDEGAEWQQKGIFAIVNNGDLNIYSGNPSRPDLASGIASIVVSSQRTNMTIDKDEKAYSRVDAIVNGGDLTVNKAVSINITNYLGYKDQSAERGACTVATTGIYNTSNTATCKVNAAAIDVLAQAHAITERTKNDIEHGRSFAYGIYGGQVSVSGASTMHTNAYARMACSDSGISNKENGCLITVAYDICTSGEINITGGTFTYETSHACNQAVTKKGSSWCYEGAVCYSGAAPMIADGTFTPPEGNTGVRGNSKTFNEAVITKASVLPYSGYALFHTDSTPGTSFPGVYDTFNEPSNPTGTIQAGQFTDESGNTYSCALDSTDDTTHPTAIVRGAFDGTYRVHVIYRYWTNSTKSAIETSVVGTDGTVGYSYKPLGDGTNIVSNAVALNGVTDGKLVRTGSATLSYKNGGEPKNNYFWKQFNMASATTSSWFSDYNVTSSTNRGTVFKSFVDTTNGNVAASTNPVYIFVDYYKVEPTGITASAGTNGTATVTYTGEPIKASDCGLKISDGVTMEDYTAEYNIDFANSGLIPVSYTWSGTNAAGKDESGTGALPTNAGSYTVTMNIEDDTTYDPNDCSPTLHKNRRALEYTFTLVIEQASVTRGNLASAVTLTYGEKLSDKLNFTASSSYKAKGVKNEEVPGAFGFTNSSDGVAYKNVGTSSVSVTFTPSYGSTAAAKNYKATTFTVNYTVAPAALVISPNEASVAYGNTEFETPFSASFTGLVANDNNDAVKSAISAALNYMILVNGSYVAYSPDDVGAGTYDIRARVNSAAVPAVLSNYTYSYADLATGYDVHQLTVTKRGLTVKASAVAREYAPDNYSVNVTYTIVSGKYGVDDVRFPMGTGTLADNSAGTKEVGSVTKAAALNLLTGGAAGNYTIAELIYETGSTLTVDISKAVPSVATPSVADVFYRRTAKLADIAINTASTSVPGTWQWADPTINPTVAVSSYTAKFVPTDSVNYDVKTVEVSFNVKPTPVTVSYTGTVEYGDPVPNITAYTYASVQDPDFDINYVTTSGNITPSTTYTQGAAVNAEGYPVVITAPNYKDAAGNYTFTAANGKIIVTPRNIEFTVENASIVYGDNFTASASTVTLTHDENRLVGADTIESITSDGSAPVFTYTTTFRYQDNYNVGTYEIKATPSFNTSPNYTVSVKNGTLTVTKAPLTIKGNNITLAYNSAVPELSTAYTFVGAKRNEGISAIVTSGAVSVDTNYEKGSPVTAEGYPLTVDITAAAFKNYSVTVENGKITVVKATPEITAYGSASITYGQSLADAVFTGAVITDNVPGTFVYGSASTTPDVSTDPYTIYTATFVPADTANYNTVPGLYIPLTVNKMAVSGALAVSGIPMKGETLTVDVSGLDPDVIGVYTFAWKINGETVGTGTTLALTENEVGKVITVVATAQGRYEGTAQCVITEIAPELPGVDNILDAAYFDLAGLDAFGATKTVVYDAQNHPVSVSLNNSALSTVVVGAITVKYNGSTEIPVNAGIYVVTVDVATPDLSRVNETGVTTYSPASNLMIGTLEITKADYNVTVTVDNKIYDGYNTAAIADVTETGAVTLAGGVKDDVRFDAENAVFTFADANVGTAKAVNTGTVALKGASASNYDLNVTLANGGKADITPRTLKVKVEPIAREYQENYYDVDLSFVVDVTTIAPADTTANVYVNEALATGTAEDYHAGTRRVTVSGAQLAGTKAENYVLEITNAGTATVEIEKAVPSYPIPNTGILYYDSGRTLSNISLGDSRWAWDSEAANVIPGAGTHTFNAVYTPDDTNNYAAVDYVVTINVRKAPITVRSASFNVIYGEEEPTYYYTVSGLTGTDTKNDLGGYVIQSCSYAPGSDIGTYSVVLTGGFTSDNYSFTYVPGTVTVTQRPVYVTAEAAAREYEEGNRNMTVNFSALSNIYGPDASNVYLAQSSVAGTVANDTAGMKAVSYELPALAGAKADNYVLSVLNPDLKGEILKAHLPGIVLPTAGTVPFGQRLSSTEFTSSYSGIEYGTFSMVDPMTTPAAVGTTNNVYKVMFTPNNTLNYATETAYITLTVTMAKLDVAIAIVGEARVDSTLYVSTGNVPAGADAYIVYRWYRVDSANADVRTGTLVASDSDSYKMKEADAGKFIICEASARANSPYEISGKAVTSATVEKLKLSFWEKIVNWFYRVIAAITQLFGRI